MSITMFIVGSFAVNTYLVVDEPTQKAASIDPSMGSEQVLAHIQQENLSLEYIINTPGHLAHVFEDSLFKENSQAQLLIHRADAELLQGFPQQALLFGITAKAAPEPDRLLEDGDVIEFGETRLEVIHTPGHSQGGICLLMGNVVFVGDTLFAGSIGRFDFAGGSLKSILNGVRERLFVLPDDTMVLPGHGPNTTIGEEKRNNPFFQPEQLLKMGLLGVD